MIKLEDLNPHSFPTNQWIDRNLEILRTRINELEEAFENTLTITSGLRSEEMQEDLIKQGISHAQHSKHCAGAACDVYDDQGLISDFVISNPKLMEKIGFWIEDPKYTHGWVHFQIMAPASGKRVFIP